MTTWSRPPADLTVDVEMARLLLTGQHPDLADLPVVRVAEGWDNVVFRLGDHLALRFPRRTPAATLIEHELRWLPSIGADLPLSVPVPVRSGRPGAGYPWSWAVIPWLPGRSAAQVTVDDPGAAAHVLGRFVATFGRPAPAGAPRNPYRGVPLADRSDALLARVTRLGALVDTEAVRARWSVAMAAPRWSRPPVWLHGDLHPANLLVDRGRLSAVIDFGDLTSGDPATDLSVAWMLFDTDTRRVFRAAAGDVDDATWARARGNALAHGVACLASSADDPVIAGIGRTTVTAVLADDD